MALTYGFYNSIEGDRVYDAIQFGRIFDGIIKDGVYATYEKGMMVIASDNASEVIIQPGRAWFNHTWSYNDANIIFSAPAPEVLLERIDTLVLEVNEELSARENSYKWVTGTPSSRPVAPTLTNTSTIHQYPLCDVHRYPETTMIYTRDITNRIGTSDCPFATGVLEGIDLDAWINQWDDEFKTWENETKSDYDTWERTVQTQFETWMLNQESVFTAWYNAFKSQMQDDVTEVENFVAYLETVLDASTAVHLQEEIDDLKDDITAGSHITVTTINTELYNRNVTITEPAGTVITSKFDGTGVAEFKSVPYVGNLTISSTYGDQTAERVVNTPYYARYSFAIAFWAATVNISGDIEFAGETVTIKDSNNVIVGTVVLDSSATGVYTAIKPDTYKFTLTYGGETMEVTLSVTQETTYTVDLHAASFRWQDWLEAGGVTGSYSSLDDVLADEVALRRLFTVHASVDYMANINDENEDVEKIINCDLAAKWINLRDYALDTLYANTIIKGYMDTADKYFYGEWALVGQVPKMTSNTAPYGEAFASNYTSLQPYLAFDQNISEDSGNDLWQYMTNSPQTLVGEYIGYDFITPTVCKVCEYKTARSADASYIVAHSITIKGSNDKQTWASLKTQEISAGNTNKNWIAFENDTPYRYYAVFYNSHNMELTNSRYFDIAQYIQFYAWQPKGNVPVMTANNAPYGTVAVSATLSGYDGYKAFDGVVEESSAHMWVSNASHTNQYIQYKFVNPVAVRRVIYVVAASDPQRDPKNTKIQASNDGANWVDVHTFVGTQHTANTVEFKTIDFENNDYYLYWRFFVIDVYNTTTNTNGPALEFLQFYGRELSVSVPTMTSDTAPFGEAFASSVRTGQPYYAWKAFDNDLSTFWQAYNVSPPQWIGYKFTNKVKVEFTKFVDYASRTYTFTIQGSNDNTDWKDITESQTISSTVENTEYWYKSTKNVDDYLYYRINFTSFRDSGGSQYADAKTVQFYGKDYSEREFEEGTTKKWLYDHGVELVTITYNGADSKGNYASNDNAEIRINNPSTLGLSGCYCQEDATPYSTMRVRIGENCSTSMSLYGEYAIGYDVTTPAYTWNAMDGYAGHVSSSAANPNAPNNVGLDISNVNQYTYLMISAGDAGTQSGYNKHSFTEWWLE